MTLFAPAISVQDDYSEHDTSWDVLFVFTIYRLCLAVLFLMLFNFSTIYQSLGELDPIGYLTVNTFYLMFSLVSLITTGRRMFAYRTQVMVQVMVDILVLLLLKHTSNMSSGFGILLNASVAGGSLLLMGNRCYLLAAFAAVGVWVESAIQYATWTLPHNACVEIGILIAILFATAMLGQGLAKRIRISVDLANARGEAVRRLRSVNNAIIEQMQQGVIVLDEALGVNQINESARHILFGEERQLQYALPSSLRTQLYESRQSQVQALRTFRSEFDGREYNINQMPLPFGDERMLIVLLEDLTRTTEQAGQMKLASLGELTASIAHEIRNPIAAISHAAQLLQETSDLDDAQRHLSTIIHNQTGRVDTIIKNILQLSRREPPVTQRLDVVPWLESFGEQFEESYSEPIKLALTVIGGGGSVRVDATQLQQILQNLCDNALHYSYQQTGRRWVGLICTTNRDDGTLTLAVCDEGPGVDEQEQTHLFEPFHTTREGGTGLGLYIAKTLCELNRARLHYSKRESGSCFNVVMNLT